MRAWRFDPSTLSKPFCHIYIFLDKIKQTNRKTDREHSNYLKKIGKENLTEPGLEPRVSGLLHKFSSIWAIQPLDGGPPK